MKIILSLTLLLICLTTIAQPGKQLLLNERLVDRPLTMHKNQLQFNTAYRLHYSTGLFTDEGEKTSLQEEGMSLMTHNYTINIAYGIFEFIEVSAATDVMAENKRIRTGIKAGYDGMFSYGGNIDTRGFKDLFCGLSVSVPPLKDIIHLKLQSGLLLPLGGNNPEEPEHILSFANEYAGSFDIQYQYLNRPGEGVMFSVFGGGLKKTIHDLSFSSEISLFYPMKEGTTWFWHSRITGSSFQYEKEEYSYLPQSHTRFYFNGDYQVFPWFAAGARIFGSLSKGGWIERYDNKYTVPEVFSLYTAAGFEIQITPLLRFYQSFSIPISGKNVESGLIILSQLSFNFFPLE